MWSSSCMMSCIQLREISNIVTLVTVFAFCSVPCFRFGYRKGILFLSCHGYITDRASQVKHYMASNTVNPSKFISDVINRILADCLKQHSSRI